MSKMKWFRWLVIPVLLGLISLPGLLFSPQAAQALPGKLNQEELAAATDSTVIGTVVGRHSQWNAAHTSIYTAVVIGVEKTLQGTFDQDKITLIVPGGEVDGIGQWVSDTPRFVLGERVFSRELTQFKEQINPALGGRILPYGVEPVIAGQTVNGISPSSASAGTNSQVTISGSGFGATPGEVHFFYRSGQPTINGGVVSWSDSNILVTVPIGTVNGYPASASSGPVHVRTAAGVESNNFVFTVTFSYGGVKWSGAGPVVKYKVNSNTADCSGEEIAVQNAANTWSAVPNQNFSFNYAGTTTATGYSYDGVNEIMWRNLGSGGTLARTIYWYYTSTSTIVEADIEFNDYYTWSTATTPLSGRFDVQSIALHELGHWLNLRDLYGQDSAKVMYGFGSGGATKRVLHADDQAGIQWIYPGGMPTPATLTVTAPNGVESWQAGTSQTIRWTYTGNPGASVEIDLLKGGVLDSPITLSTATSTGSYLWPIPSSQTVGTDYQVRLTSTTNTAITDSSNTYFSITEPPPVGLTVTSPNGGDSWQAGTSQTIRWTYTGNPGASVEIELLKGGVPSSTIISSTATSTGSYLWPIPSSQTAGDDYQVSITSTGNATITDTSDGNFNIAAPPPVGITVTSPNGGESWRVNTYQTIRWTYTGSPGAYVKIELLKNGVVNRVITYRALIGSGGSGSYRWLISYYQTAGTDYKVRITSTSNTAITDSSNANFRITRY